MKKRALAIALSLALLLSVFVPGTLATSSTETETDTTTTTVVSQSDTEVLAADGEGTQSGDEQSVVTDGDTVTGDGQTTDEDSVTGDGQTAGEGTVTGDGQTADEGTVTGDGQTTGEGTVTGDGQTTDQGAVTGDGQTTDQGTVTGDGQTTEEGTVTGDGQTAGEGTVTDDGQTAGEGTVTDDGQTVDEGNVTGDGQTADPTEATAATDPTETTAATDPTETTAATEPTDPVCTCPGTEEKKAAEGFVHQEGCPLYVPAEEEKDSFEELFEKILMTQSTQEITDLLAGYTEEEVNAFAQWMEDNGKVDAFSEHVVQLLNAEFVPPVTHSVTNAGPFMPPVTVGGGFPALFSFFSADPEPEDNGLVTSKKVTTNGDGTYTITMEAYTTGTVTSTEKAVPVDVVLVLDQSGSMNDGFGVTSRQAAMKNAVKNFIDSVGGKYSPAADHRIAIVQFAGGASTVAPWTPADTAGQEELKGSVDRLNANGATNVAAGMQQAAGLINNSNYKGSNTERQQVVIVFTDGVPTTSNIFDTGDANDAIDTAHVLKNKGVTVYTVGIFEGANPNQLYGNEWTYATTTPVPCSGDIGSYWGGSWAADLFGGNDFPSIDVPAGNRFLNYLSSGYMAYEIGVERGSYNPKDHLGLIGYGLGYKITVNSNRLKSGYYLTASDEAGLNGIFQSISNEISTPNISLGSDTVIKDIVTSYFAVPENAEDIKLYTAASTNGTDFGDRQEAADLTVNIVDSTISVSGFDFNANFVSETPRDDNFYGKKLIIEFTVSPKTGFLGGNGVPTNGPDSGVYQADGTLVEAFPVPTADVPIPDVNVTATGKNVYLMASPTTADLQNGATVAVGDTSLDLSKVDNNYGLYPWQTEFVEISFSAEGKDGATLEKLTEDTQYTLIAKVSPNDEGTVKEKTGSANANIQVFKPEITWQDSQLNSGEIPAYDTQNFVKDEWKHGDVLSTAVTMIGTEPQLAYTYTPAAVPINVETPVEVTVKIEDEDVSGLCAFIHETCSFEGCKWEEKYNTGNYQFVVHLKSFDLTISKEGWESIDENQSFVFTVSGEGLDMQVVIPGNDSKTIKGLPSGTYTITEDTSWSWRYTTDSQQTVEPGDVVNGKVTVTFDNSRSKIKWLNGCAYKDNPFNEIAVGN